MKKNEVVVLVVFFLLMGPRPTDWALFANRFYVAFAPIVAMGVFYLCFREELSSIRWDERFKDSGTRTAFFKSLQYSIYAQAGTTVVFGTSTGISDDMLQTYPLMPFYAIMIAPIAEEIVYRKIIFKFLHKHMNFWLAAGLSSLLFALGHFSLNRFTGYFLTGMIFCNYYKKCRTIVPIMAAHCAINFISLLVVTLKG